MEELCRKSLQDTRYCIVMVAGERSLADVMVKEHLQGDWGRIRSLCMSLARAVEHMHDRGFIHGDLKRKCTVIAGAFDDEVLLYML
jgi:serine/threonine protein kinase